MHIYGASVSCHVFNHLQSLTPYFTITYIYTVIISNRYIGSIGNAYTQVQGWTFRQWNLATESTLSTSMCSQFFIARVRLPDGAGCP